MSDEIVIKSSPDNQQLRDMLTDACFSGLPIKISYGIKFTDVRVIRKLVETTSVGCFTVVFEFAIPKGQRHG